MRKIVRFIAIISAVFIIMGGLMTTASAEGNTDKEWPSDPGTSPTKKWEVKFSEAVDPAYINSNYFNVTDYTTGANRFAEVTLESKDGGKVIVVHPPKEGYAKGALYLLKVSDKIQSVSGKLLGTVNYKKFKIQSPNVGDQQVTEVLYKENFKALNHGQQIERINLPQAAAFAIYKQDDTLLDFGLARSELTLNPGEYAILSFEQKVHGETVLPANITYEVSKTPAILNVTHDKSVSTIWNHKSKQEYAELKFTGKHLSYYTLGTDNEIDSLTYISEEDPINTIRVEKQAVVSAEVDSTLQIYAPYNEFTYMTRLDPAVETLVLGEGKSVILSNKGTGKSHYSVFNPQDYMSEVDEVLYSDLKGKTVQRIEAKAKHMNELGYSSTVSEGNQVHLTNRSGNDVIIYAPVGDFIFETASIPALHSKVVKKGETAFIENHFSQWQSVRVEGEGLHDYVHYNNYEQHHASELLSSKSTDEYSLRGLSTIAITAKTDEPVTVIAPFTNTTVTITTAKQAIDYYTVAKGQSILIENTQLFKQPGLFIEGGRIDSVTYEKDGTPFFQPNIKIEPWSRNFVLAEGGKRHLTNLTDEPLIIALPEGSFQVFINQDNAIEKPEIGSMETVIFTNTSNADQSIAIEGVVAKFDFVHYTNLAKQQLHEIGYEVEQDMRDSRFELKPTETLVFTNKTSQTLSATLAADKFTIEKGVALHTSTQAFAVGAKNTYTNKTDSVQIIGVQGTGKYTISYYKFGMEQPFYNQHDELAGRNRFTLGAGQKMSFTNDSVPDMKISILKNAIVTE